MYTRPVKLFGTYNKIFASAAYSDIKTTSTSFLRSHSCESILCSLFCSLSPALFAPAFVKIAGSCRICFAVAEATQELIRIWRSERLSLEDPPGFWPSSVGSLCRMRRSRLMDIFWWRKKAGRISLRYSAPSARNKDDNQSATDDETWKSISTGLIKSIKVMCNYNFFKFNCTVGRQLTFKYWMSEDLWTQLWKLSVCNCIITRQ